MKFYVRSVVLTGVMVAALVLVPSAFATSGAMVITKDTTLTEDHSGTIELAADSVTLNCAGRKIIGSGSSGAGIVVYRRSNVTIRNCRVTGFDYGIAMVEDTSSVVIGNAVSNSVVGGLSIVGSQNGTFSGNILSGNRTGVLVNQQDFAHNATGNQIKENTAVCNSEDGFLLGTSNANQLTGNRSVGNGGRGFSLVGSAHAFTLAGNIAIGNRSDGFVLDTNAKGHILDANVATGNGGSGFSVVSSSNRLTRNGAFLNRAYGFVVGPSAIANTIQKNTARWNKLYDAYDQNAAYPDFWLENSFGTTSGL